MNANLKTFTPGPWTLHAGSTRTFIYGISAEHPKGCLIAALDNLLDEDLANARLIAAAPALAAALQAIVERQNTWGFDAVAAGDIARAALAEAGVQS